MCTAVFDTYQARSVNVAQCRLLTTHMGVFCCVSYNRTASCVATAYTMRYARENAGLGPGVDASVSTLPDFDPLVVSEAAVLGGGGGSITEVAGDGFATGSGSEGSGSSDDDVSIVMCFVEGGDWRRV